MGLLKSKVFMGTVVMTVFSVLVRVLGFVFRIRLADLVGTEGMGKYQLVTSVYMLGATLVTSGIGAAVTRLTAETVAKNGLSASKSVTRSALRMVFLPGLFVGGALFFAAPLWTKLFLYDPQLVGAVRILGPCMPFIAWCACFSGYFYGTRRVLPASFTQFLEQLVRIGVLFFGLVRMGEAPLYARVTLAVAAISLGEILSCLYIAFRYRCCKDGYGAPVHSRELLSVSMPIAANGYLNAVLRLTENVLIPRLLLISGLTMSRALSLFGLLKGMVLPVLQLPSAIISALAMNLMPALAEAHTQGHNKRVRMALEKSIEIACVGGILAVGLLLSFAEEVGVLLYHNREAGVLLRQLAFICPLIYLEIVLVGALNSLGRQRTALRNSLIDSAAKLIVLILGVPRYGFSAYLAAVAAGCVVCVAANFSTLSKTVSISLNLRRLLVCPTFSALMATLPVWSIKKAAGYNALPLLSRTMVGVGVFMILFGLTFLLLKEKGGQHRDG